MNDNDPKKAKQVIDAFTSQNQTPETEEVFGQWLVDERRKKEKDTALFSLWNRISVKNSLRKYAVLRKIKLRLGLPVNRYHRRLKISAVAAIILLTLTLGSILYLNENKQSLIQAPITLTLVTEERPLTDTLPDNTMIDLAEYSTVHYMQEPAGDVLIALRGEGSFDVETKTDRSFTVRTSVLEINVRGTKFRVREVAGENYTSVSLERGKIEVKLPEETVIMEPEHLLTYDHVTKKILYDKIMSTSGDVLPTAISFTRTKLKEVFKGIANNYRLEFTITEGPYLDETISIGFDGKESPESIMFILQNLSGKFSYSVNGTSILVRPN